MGGPVVGLTAYPRVVHGPDSGWLEGVDRRYVSLLVAAGAVPVVLPVQDPASAATVLSRLDGLVLTGGGDVEPHLYDAPVVAKLSDPSAERDAFEFALIHAAHRSGLPTIGICRGMQCLNVAFGGTLLQSLEAAGLAENHLRPIEEVGHELLVVPSTKLSGIVGAGPVSVNSRHHQSVDRCADGWIVSARASDGVIEAIEPTGDWWALGVQWHLEAIAGTPESKGVLREFVRVVQDNSRGPSAPVVRGPHADGVWTATEVPG